MREGAGDDAGRSAGENGFFGKANATVAILGAAATLIISVVNTVLSHRSEQRSEAIAEVVRQQEQSIRLQQMRLEVGKDQLARYTFVQGLMEKVLTQDAREKTLSINLITLALGSASVCFWCKKSR